jgi:serine/threonine-protein kinase
MAGTEERYCPICEERMYETRCPSDGVQTIPYAALKSSTSQLAAGAIIGERFRVEHLLGSGAMGSVYAATQIAMDRRVALKVLVREAMRDGTEVRRFFLEAKNASRLKHPNVVRVYDFGIDEPTQMPFIAMELVDGKTLRRLIAEAAPMPLPRVARLLEQVSKALVTAHSAGIIHRDLKPDNIMVGVLPGDDEHVTVLDFGIAKSMRTPGGLQESLTASGVVVGTPRYMSPEQVRGQPADARADLYSLGCIFHEMLNGSPPFSAEDSVSLMLEHVNAVRPALPDVEAAPESLEAARVLHSMLLAREPEFRPASAGPVASVFRDLALGRLPENPAARLATAGSVSIDSGPESSQDGFAPSGETDTQIKHPRKPLPTPVDSRAFDSPSIPPQPQSDSSSSRTGLIPLAGALVVGVLIAVSFWFVFSEPSTSDEAVPAAASSPTAGDPAPATPAADARESEAAAAPTEELPAEGTTSGEAAEETTVVAESEASAGSEAQPTTDGEGEAEPNAVEPEPPEHVTVVVRGSPRGAVVRERRSGRRLGSLGEPIRLDYGESRVSLVVSKRAFISKVVTVTPNRDRTLRVKLIPDLAPRSD